MAIWYLYQESTTLLKFHKYEIPYPFVYNQLEELYTASSFGACLYIKSDLHKILDNFYLNGFHMEETTSYNNSAHMSLSGGSGSVLMMN